MVALVDELIVFIGKVRLLDFRDGFAVVPTGMLGSEVVIFGGEMRVGSDECLGLLPECA